MEVTDEEIRQSTIQLSQEAGIENEKPYKKLFYATNHLPYFAEFDKIISLDGYQYLSIKKIRYYQLLGGTLQKSIRLGKLYTDTRIQVLYPLPTEAGKNSLIYSFKSIIGKGIKKSEEEIFTLSEPISYSAESLVGKYIERVIKLEGEKKGRKQRIENRGHFANDFLEFDECTKLIMSNEEQVVQAREYLSKAENPIGKNEVQKRLVDDLPSETVAYFPQCTNSFYFQPSEKIPESVMTQGFMRRKLIPVGNISKFLIEANADLIKSKMEGYDISINDVIEKFAGYLQTIRERTYSLGHPIEYTFTEDAKELIEKYTLTILNQGKAHSEKIANFCKINKYTTHDYLVRMSCILASAYGKTAVTGAYVHLAFMDLTEFMQNTYEFIFQNVKGNFDYGSTWQGAKYYDIECLKFLHKNDALSFETSQVSISDFLKKIQEVYPNSIKEDMARKHYDRMRKEGWVEGKQEGQHASKVWLKFNPQIQKELDEGMKGSKGYNLYKSVFYGINDVLAGLPPLASLGTSGGKSGF